MAHSNGQMEGAGATPPTAPVEGYAMVDSVALEALAEAQMEDAWQTHLSGGGLAVKGTLSAPTAEAVDVIAPLAVETGEFMLRKGEGARIRTEKRHHSSGSHIPEAEESAVIEGPIIPISAEAAEAERVAKAKAEASATTPRRDRYDAKNVLRNLVRTIQAGDTKPTQAEAVDAVVI